MSTARRVAAVAAGLGTAATSLAGLPVLLAHPAFADPAPGQEIDNDWGQTAAQVQAEIDAVVDADASVVQARTRYLRALADYAAIKKGPYAGVEAKVYPFACEVVASQLAMTKVVNAVTAAVRSHHFVKAPYVALPAMPTGLQATGQSGQVSLVWDDVAGASSYRVFRDGRQVATTLLPALVDTGLDNGTSYDYFVIAINVAGWSARSASATGTPTVATPDVPVDLVVAPDDAGATLTWTGSVGATGYRIYRDGVQLATTTDPSFVDTGLVNGTSYSYAVVALNGVVASAASAPVSVTPVALPPAAPTGLVAAPGDAQVALSWTPVSGATSYTVYRDGVPVGSTAQASFLDTGLSNGTSYVYAVAAFRENSPASPSSATTTATPVVPPLPTPTGLAATPGDGQIGLVWGAVAGATSYRVYRNGAQVATPTAPSFTDTGLVNGTAYQYWVVAVSAASVSSPSSTTTATPAAAAPGAPTGLSGQAGDTVATLSWTAVPGATSYSVYRGGVLLATLAGTTYTNTGLTNGTSYTYAVTATRNSVESPPSSTVSVTPVAVVPGVPTGLVAATGNAQVALSWTASPNAQSYQVYRGGVLIGLPAGTSFTDTGLTNGTAYSYTVSAVNGTASSIQSAPVSATPMAPAPAAPTGLTGTPGNAQVALSWTASATATSYRVYRGGVLVGSPTGTTYTDTGLTNGTSYSYYVVAVAATTPSPASSTVSVTPVVPPVNGTFTGATASIAQGHGTIRVVIVVSNSHITSATGTLLTNDGTETVSINNNAIPQYNTKAVAANSANITKVSGASLTWTAYKTSLQSALTQAGL